MLESNKKLKLEAKEPYQLGQLDPKFLVSESNKLCLQLKSLLTEKQTPTLTGHFKQGKKIDMKKIIPFIASNYSKDKIWLKKTSPQTANYDILLALDDSFSMSEKAVGSLALNCLLVTFRALVQCNMECSIGRVRGRLDIVGQREGVSRSTGLENLGRIAGQFGFVYEDEDSSDLAMVKFLDGVKAHYEAQGEERKRLCFVVGDGRLNKELVRQRLLQL